ncbi:MAG: hypothetical protein G01um101420_387 [Parcubacteria group bacterium Gr01-1014_20]|nr:MAG: hypothetical protein G01um101420_387 [Parcubacteria group bacterium Gr01-1014_20]
MKQVPLDTSPVRPPGFYKGLVLDILTVASALLLSFSYKTYLLGNVRFGILAASLLLFLILTTVEVFAVSSLQRRSLIMVLEVIALLSFFYDRADGVLFVTGGLMLLLSTIGEITSRQFLSNSLEIKFYKTSRLKISSMATALAIMFVILYLPKVNVDNINIQNIFVTPEGFQTVYAWSSGITKRLYPEVDVNSTIEKLARDIAVFKLENLEEFKALTPKDKESSIENEARQFIKELGNRFQTAISGENPTNEIFYKLMIATLEKWKNSMGNWFLAGWLLIFFLIAKGVGILVSFVASFLAFTVMQLLLGINFLHMAGENRMKETVKL